MPKTICGPCGQEFDTNQAYLEHECSKADGAKPTTPEYLKRTTMPNYDQVAEAALKRGSDKASA